MYIIADKMINDCKFDFDNFGILILQIPIASFDMSVLQLIIMRATSAEKRAPLDVMLPLSILSHCMALPWN